ncbi:MAG: Gfo/Idh/MocA family oxidoreductase [Methanomicrobiaceae archaeon]|nr:Gfo/Idh/MocA family oxidoreductase [Methanomicrobiaceae archaeon]
MEVGVLGAGNMGKNHIRVYTELKGISNVTVFDLDTQAAEQAARTNDVSVAGSMNELLNTVDAVSICVPTQYHFPVAHEVLQKGIHMLIEKPICLTAGDAHELIQSISDGLVVGVGHIERFNPIVNEIKRILKNPLYIEMKRHNPASARIQVSSVVEDLMIHDIDIVFNAFFQSDYELKCSGNGDICSALFQFGATPVYLSASRKSSKKVRMIYIEEEECTIEGDFMSQEIFIHRKPGQYSLENDRYIQENIIEKVLVNKTEPLKVELKTFIDCVKRGEQFPITPAQAAANLRICEEITRKCMV